ncbi:MAG: hypothetical protein GXP56_18245 [Deltaproteobacteria bacterium]|nr:hypothetical protein [Deltaproteobacteria bacterium]
MIRFWKKFKKKISKNPSKPRSSLQLRYKAFLGLLTENEHALDLMTELENKYYNQQLISMPYLKSMIKNLARTVKNIIFDLSALSGGRYNHLLHAFEDMEKEVREFTSGSKDPIYTPIIIPMDKITARYIDKVGSKMANLGELKNKCNLQIPDGFGLTACAYTHFSEYNTLSEKIANILHKTDVNKSHELLAAEKKIKQLIADVKMPPEIEEVITKKSRKLEKNHNRRILWAVRSSAIGEDLEHSFAGQFSSILNVPARQLLEKYKAVVASKYNTRSILYQRVKNIRSEDVNMSVGFLEMVDAKCSGVLYTTDPVRPDKQEIVISAIWGLGQLLVEGAVSADTYILMRTPDFALSRKEIVPKKIALKLKEQGGLKQIRIPEELITRPCLTKEQLCQLGKAALTIEAHFKCAQDIEWCFDEKDQLIILQSRPLHLNTKQEPPASETRAPIISDRARPVAAGAGAGKVFKAGDIHDLFDFPKGGVLVIKNSSPQYIGAFQKASAVVVEKGNLTDHMSSVVREFKVPCVVRVPNIFSILENGREITVDATRGVIYEGIIHEILTHKVTMQPIVVNIERTESYCMLRKIADLIFPLNLTDPRAVSFKEESCRTWHDIIRFCHETALNEMFSLKDKAQLGKIKNIYKIKTKLPLSLFLLNLFENAVTTPDQKRIGADSIVCKPFQALWSGMNAPGVSWQGPDQMAQAGGIFTAMIRTPSFENIGYDTRSFAVVTPSYMNLSLSMGYHYVAVDSYVSDDPYLNHITISFKGGAADIRKRSLRILLVSKILKQAGFKTHVNQDFLKARIKAEEADTINNCLYIVGKMLAITRLLDLSIENETTVESYVTEFYRSIDLPLA